MSKLPTALLFLAALSLVACGPNRRGDGDDTGDDAPDANLNCTATAPTEGAGTCNDGFDNDCNGFVDCDDGNCFGADGCEDPANCEIETPSVSFPLPDGDCGIAPPPGSSEAEMDAFLMTCGAYDGVMNLSGFPAGARLDDPSKLLAICVTMEHTWLRDLQMEAHCPDGQRVKLSRFEGQDCPNINAPCEVFLGVPITEPCDGEPTCTPQPGTGWEYCWATAATNQPMIPYSNQDGAPHDLPEGDYQPSQPFAGFQGCSLNGAWTIRIVDGWGIDNGVVFGTRMIFDGSLSDDCPIIE